MKMVALATIVLMDYFKRINVTLEQLITTVYEAALDVAQRLRSE